MTSLVGIINITPDSFFDGGSYASIDAALNQVEIMIEAGASVIDLGAESTRPGATSLDANEEWERLKDLLPAIILLCSAAGVKSSLDSYHQSSILKALELGLDIVNDISGEINPIIAGAIAEDKRRQLILVDNRRNSIAAKTPTAIQEKWRVKLDMLKEFAIDDNQIILDPGIGFGGNPAENAALIKNASELAKFAHKKNHKILYAHSNKSCLGHITGQIDSTKRIGETISSSCFLSRIGVDYLRVHNVAEIAAALKLDKYLYE